MHQKVLVLGASSYIGKHLLKKLGREKSIGTYHNSFFPNGVKFDILQDNLDKIITNPKEISCAVILFGDTDPDSCAKDKKRSNFLNVLSMKKVIDQLLELGIKPVFASSEFIFDGIKGNYKETDYAKPILTYGKQKLEVERYLKKKTRNFLIVRFAKVYGDEIDDGTLFTSMLKKIINRETIVLAKDQIFSPIFVTDLVEAIVALISNKKYQGIYHLGGLKPYNRIELYEILFKYIKKYRDLQSKIKLCSLHDLLLLEKRPLNVSLNPNKLLQDTKIKLRSVENICDMIIKNYFH